MCRRDTGSHYGSQGLTTWDFSMRGQVDSIDLGFATGYQENHAFSGWIEAYPICTERASKVVRWLLKELIPCFGLPSSLQSDNGPSFVTEITQKVSEHLKINWCLHAPIVIQKGGKGSSHFQENIG